MTWTAPQNEIIKSTWTAPKDEIIGGSTTAPSEGGSVLDKLAATGAEMLRRGPMTVAREAFSKNPEPALESLPTAGAVIGGATGGPLGAGMLAAGGKAAAIAGKKAIGSESPDFVPKDFSALDSIAELGKKGPISVAKDFFSKSPATQEVAVTGAAAAAGEGLMGLATKGASALAPKSARRALGITKGTMNNTKSFRESLRLQARAEKAGESMLEEGAIPLLGGAEKTKTNVMKVLNKAGSEMNAVRDSLKGKTINVDDLGGKILDEIKTDFPGQNKVGLEILNDLEAVRGKVDINKLQELKSRFAKLGYVDRTVGTDASLAYRKAADTLDRYMNDFIEANASKEAAVRFQSAKKLYGDASFAMKGVSQEIAAQLGNNLFSLPSYILAGAELAGGNPLKAASTVGIIQALRNRGSAVTANALKGVSKAPKGLGAGLSEILRRSKDKK